MSEPNEIQTYLDQMRPHGVFGLVGLLFQTWIERVTKDPILFPMHSRSHLAGAETAMHKARMVLYEARIHHRSYLFPPSHELLTPLAPFRLRYIKDEHSREGEGEH